MNGALSRRVCYGRRVGANAPQDTYRSGATHLLDSLRPVNRTARLAYSVVVASASECRMVWVGAARLGFLLPTLDLNQLIKVVARLLQVFDSTLVLVPDQVG